MSSDNSKQLTPVVPDPDGPRSLEEVRRLRSNISHLLRAVAGDCTPCRGCGAPIWWIRTKTGRPAPWTADGLNHFADCPAASSFRGVGS